MCGIAGFILSPLDYDIDTAAICADMGLAIEHRGHDATGVVRVSQSGRVKISKSAQKAADFFAARKGIGDGAITALIHTRAWTQGDPSDNNNNHPIQVGKTIGIHNGWINNDYELYRQHNWKRFAKVDSEALFAAVEHLGWKDALESVEGAVAAAWIDLDDPRVLHLAKAEASPLWIGMTLNGSLFFGSEMNVVEAGMWHVPDDSLKGCDPTWVEAGTYVAYAGDDFDFQAWDRFQLPIVRPKWTSGTYSGGLYTPSESWDDDDGWISRYNTTKAAADTRRRIDAVAAQRRDEADETIKPQLGDRVWCVPRQYEQDPDGVHQHTFHMVPAVVTRVGFTMCGVRMLLDKWTLADTDWDTRKLMFRTMEFAGLDKVDEVKRPTLTEALSAMEADRLLDESRPMLTTGSDPHGMLDNYGGDTIDARRESIVRIINEVDVVADDELIDEEHLIKIIEGNGDDFYDPELVDEEDAYEELRSFIGSNAVLWDDIEEVEDAMDG